MGFTKQEFLEQVNLFLTLSLIYFVGYLVVFPLFPQVAFAFSDKEKNTVEAQIELDKSLVEEFDTDNNPIESPDMVISNERRLIIPSIGVDGKVLVGDSADLLNHGFWHRPNTSTPDKGGNTVFTGHRFLYKSGPETFYHLDKVEIGDSATVIWNGIRYDYEVFDIVEVTPDMIEIEAPTDEPILTFYTCTPLWTAEKRLVVRARLVQQV
ncbi:class E sortase [Candidatus Dojkabacteria bacterium]|uniref:Class E sortase n=1 Tax=Candidatus Dojkabacteria bacterium TaxID=2099670 RepID=A0A955LA67_9BACT|nr:class E sortase [Candidatus Dojkabacteria bacterium]